MMPAGTSNESLGRQVLPGSDTGLNRALDATTGFVQCNVNAIIPRNELGAAAGGV